MLLLDSNPNKTPLTFSVFCYVSHVYPEGNERCSHKQTNKPTNQRQQKKLCQNSFQACEFVFFNSFLHSLNDYTATLTLKGCHTVTSHTLQQYTGGLTL